MATGRLLETKILAYTKKPHLLCLSETWLRPETKPPNLLDTAQLLGKTDKTEQGGGLTNPN